MPQLAVRVATRYRVASRYLVATNALPSGQLSVGKTLESDKVRVHRYNGSIRITDITFAGKRGKTCDELTVMTNGPHGVDPLLDELGELITAKKTFQEMERVVDKFLEEHPRGVELNKRALRGVDVEPHGDKFEFEIKTERGGTIRVDVSPHSFHVIDHAPIGQDKPPAFFQDTGYWPRKKQDAQIFYAWMKTNVAKAKKFENVQEFKTVWQGLGVHYDFH